MKKLINFLEEKGLKYEDDSFKNGYTHLNSVCPFFYIMIKEAKLIAEALKVNNSLTQLDLYWGNVRDKAINEKINYNKLLFKKLSSLPI